PLRNFDFTLLGMMAALGGRTAIVRMFNCINLHGFCGWLFWRMVYWAKLPGLDRKIQVGVSWLLDLLLPPDIVQTKLDVHHGVAEAHYQAGDLIYREGDTLTRMFLITRGKAQAFRSDVTGAEVPVAQPSPGEFFGGPEGDGGVQQVGVRCLEETLVLVLPRADFEPLLQALPDAREKLAALATR